MVRYVLRILRYRLIIPILRAQNPPEQIARGVLVGLVCAMTPLVGIQMILVGLIWAIQRVVAPEWRFNVIVAMAWTWVTNVFTVPLVYYLFLITGRLMLGHFESSLGFSNFEKKLDEILNIDGGGLMAIWDITIAMVDLWGVPLFIGCLPWAILCGFIGYKWSLSFQEARQRRLQRSLDRQRKTN